MHKLLYYFTMLVPVSVVTMVTVGIFNVATAEETTNLRDEFTYGYNANLERQQDQSHELARIRSEQQQYLREQEAINQLDMYNQTHQHPGKEAHYPYTAGE